MSREQSAWNKQQAELRRKVREENLNRKDFSRSYTDLTPYNAVQSIKGNENIALK